MPVLSRYRQQQKTGFLAGEFVIASNDNEFPKNNVISFFRRTDVFKFGRYYKRVIWFPGGAEQKRRSRMGTITFYNRQLTLRPAGVAPQILISRSFGVCAWGIVAGFLPTKKSMSDSTGRS